MNEVSQGSSLRAQVCDVALHCALQAALQRQEPAPHPGLDGAQRLAQLLGHELTVASRPGKGTLFRIGIALRDLPEIQDATAAADTLPMPLGQSRTVLIIDDGEAIREGLRLLLEEWGYDAIAAGSIAEAERAVIVLEAPPDLILSDLHLGDGPDGLAAIEAEAAKLRETVEELEFRRMFNNPADPLNCFLDIQAGAGGTEA